jgi:hypothetical protein
MDLSSAGFSLRVLALQVLALARANPRRLKPAPLKNNAPEGWTRGGKAVNCALRKFRSDAG